MLEFESELITGFVQPGVVQAGVMQAGFLQPGAMQAAVMQPGAMPSGFMQPGVQPGAQSSVWPQGVVLLSPAGLMRQLPMISNLQGGVCQPGDFAGAQQGAGIS